MIGLQWFAIVVGLSGQLYAQPPITDAKTFATKEACVEYADRYVKRMPDFFAGMLNADLNTPIAVEFRCEVKGDPA